MKGFNLLLLVRQTEAVEEVYSHSPTFLWFTKNPYRLNLWVTLLKLEKFIPE
jgi:hypothetical protein